MHLCVLRLSHVCDWDAAVSIETSVLNFLNLTHDKLSSTTQTVKPLKPKVKQTNST